MPESGQEFDYVVVGGGSAGCAVAARLSEDPSHRVLLLEAGTRDTNPWIHVPIGYYRTLFDPRTSRAFTTEPDPGLAGRSISWPRGVVLGGCSSINGLAWVRGQAEDYDHWRQLGNEGWSFADVLPHFRRAEGYAKGETELRGRDGPIAVSDPVHRMELMEAFVRAANEAGIPTNPDYNGAQQDGVAYFQLSMRNGMRCSAATAYLKPARSRANLSVVTEARTTRLLVEGRHIAGVEYRQGGQTRMVRAARETILCAGALDSPHILMLSGIGPAGQLERHGIPVLHELAGVGQNLQDHLQARAVYRCPKPITLNDVGHSIFRKVAAGLEWGLFRRGPLTVGAGYVALFWKTREELATPDVEFHVIPFSAQGPGQPLHEFPGYTVSVCQLRPESRGHLELQSADPNQQMAIHPNYLATETDRRTMVDGMKLIRRVMGQPAMAPYLESEFSPGPGCTSDADLLTHVREKGTTIFHPTSTCLMAPASNPQAVVDARLRLHGMTGLRIADASIMPAVPSGNTNAPCIMIGEKCAAMVKEDARARPAAVAA